MHRGREARLGRALARVLRPDQEAAEHRGALRARAAIGEAVRWSLAQIGVDPARAVMLRTADEAASELAAMSDTQEMWNDDQKASQRDDDLSPDGDEWLDEATRRLVERYRSGEFPAPDLAQASLAELFAWCIARHDGAHATPGLNQGVQVCC